MKAVYREVDAWFSHGWSASSRVVVADVADVVYGAVFVALNVPLREDLEFYMHPGWTR